MNASILGRARLLMLKAGEPHKFKFEDEEIAKSNLIIRACGRGAA